MPDNKKLELPGGASPKVRINAVMWLVGLQLAIVVFCMAWVTTVAVCEVANLVFQVKLGPLIALVPVKFEKVL